MGMLDYLIAKNKEPKIGMEYIYLMDMVWKHNNYGHIDFVYGSIVTDVQKAENDSIEFTDKNTGERYYSNYGWAFAENTEENLIRLKEYEEVNKKLKAIEKQTKELRNNIITLKGPERI